MSRIRPAPTPPPPPEPRAQPGQPHADREGAPDLLVGKHVRPRKRFPAALAQQLARAGLPGPDMPTLAGALPGLPRRVSDRLARLRPRALLLPGGERLVGSSHLFQGAFGKVGLAVDDAGRHFATKRLRLVPKPDQKTEVTPAADAGRELQLLCRYFDPGARLFVDGERSMVLVTRPMWATLDQAADEVAEAPPDLGRALARLAAKDLMQNLAEMHANGDAYMDLKPQNAMIGFDGVARLTDFGSVCQIEGTREWGAGTQAFAPPEMVLLDAEGVGGRDLRSDMWPAALTLLALAVPWERCPLTASGLANFTAKHAFASWRERVADADGHLTTAAVEAGSGAEEHHEFDAYFRAVVATDPELADLVLNRMLVPEVGLRAGAEEVLGRLGTLLPDGGADALAARAHWVAAAAADPLWRAVGALLSAARTAGFKEEGRRPFERLLHWSGVRLMVEP